MVRMCSDVFWNGTKAWYVEHPDFTHCFEQIALVGIPCLFLWLCIPVEVYKVITENARLGRWTKMTIAKMGLCIILVILELMDLGYAAQVLVHFGTESLPAVNIISPLIQVFTFLLAMVYIDLDRRKGRISNAILFVFWLLLAVAGIIILRSKVLRVSGKEPQSPDDVFGLFTYEVFFPIVVIQLILSAFADNYPERFENWTKNPSPEQSASFLNKAFSHWITELMRTAWKRQLLKDDIWDLLPEERTEYLDNELTKAWRKQITSATGEEIYYSDAQSEASGHTVSTNRRRANLTNSSGGRTKTPSLVSALYKTSWPLFWKSAFFKVIHDGIMVLVPLLVGQIIQFAATPAVWSWKGYVLATILFLMVAVQSIAFGMMNISTSRCGMRIRSALSAMIYRKALFLANSSKRQYRVGDACNMLTADTQRISDFLYYHHYVWITPVTAMVMMYFLWQYVGVASLAGFFTLIFIVLLNFIVVARAKKFEVSAVKQKDGRVRRINEIFNGIKILKMYAWEPQFQDQIIQAREDELFSLKKAGYLTTINHALMLVSSPLAALATYATYVYVSGYRLTPKTGFVTLLFLFSLRHSLYLLPIGTTLLIQAKIACNRLRDFFLARELDPSSVDRFPRSESPHSSVMMIVGGNFSWNSRSATGQALTLKNLNIDVKQGQLFALVGAVGSGKSSFLAACLGLMERISGHVTIRGSVAYVTQQAWNQNMTMRDNILFGRPFDEEKYERVLECCALKPDLEILTSGDQTEIGEKGINLSGGQKLRVTLARAVYAGCDLYFLDDPLSAVDAHVGKHIFENVIGPQGILKDKTRIFVTNAINWLPECDTIAYLEQGRISEMGSYDELVDRDERFSDFLRQCNVETSQDEEAAPADDEAEHGAGYPENLKRKPSEREKPLDRDEELRQLRKAASLRPPPDGNISQSMEVQPVRARPKQQTAEGGKIIATEEFSTGGIPFSTYWRLIKEMTIPMAIVIFFGYIAANAFFLFSNMWVAKWAQTNTTNEDGSTDWAETNFEVAIYGLIALLQLIFAMVGLYGIAAALIKAGRSLHNSMLIRLMRAPMSYFDTTPLGRIVNRFSKDIDTIDSGIPMQLRFVMNAFFQAVVFALLVLIVFPFLTAFAIPLFIVAYFVKSYYTSTALQLKRLDVLSRSPLISSLQESMAGSSIIAAMQQSDRFVLENRRKIDHVTAVIHCSNASLHWMMLVLMLLCNTQTFAAAIFAVYGRDYLGYDAKPAFVGLGLIGAISLTLVFPWWAQNMCDLENALISVERLYEYSNTPVEAPAIVANNRVPSKWPYNGNIAFVDYQTRYREGLDLVLDGVTCTIHSGEKIGIVGRTGSGKSTMTLSLLRMIEPAGGSIYIDGTDISKIGLHDLRSRITIIPQESVLFSGTLRLNLDPFEQSSDEQIWKALELSRLKPYFQASQNGLNFKVTESGGNLSVGQRQLLCLARALLRRSKILILDEATAAIDFETDNFVQEIIRSEFAECTIITIAHRLNTIMDATRVMVMEAGRIKEFETPEKLLENPNSLFYKLAKDAGQH
ncbi:LOW QUALITY PROTEIN: multidrug resistance-associated protein 1-like [Paramacrobiotus metropolitanus]|uniref:LOW QUALITY PROTEIN: multidrug resistance-associated protein 1-like n=1 Tax=Paramacrobiotus metropolitanus TaxID=2943436 RepID=UPI002445F489|nr:LOW QUALITY PROTEIN: multidrug resistance-associated protein 1-like [Paramacrobiotus metropolitanus]